MRQYVAELRSIVKKPMNGVLACALFAAPLSAQQIKPTTQPAQVQQQEVLQTTEAAPLSSQQLRANVQLELMRVLRTSHPNAGFIAIGPLYERIERWVKSVINWMLGKAENPVLMLEQAIREMQIKRNDMRRAVVRAIAAQKKTEKNYNAKLEEVELWTKRAQEALAIGREDLAKGALKKKRPYQKIVDSLEVTMKTQSEQVEKLKTYLNDFEERVNNAEAQKEILIARAEAAASMSEIRSALDELNVDGAAWAFKEAEEDVLQMENEVEAWEELDQRTIEEEFEELEQDESIEEELARLKGE